MQPCYEVDAWTTKIGVVLRNGVKVYGPSDLPSVEAKRDELERLSRARQRPCLTCGELFLSEGPHNRMCSGCRRAASEIYQGAV